MTTLSPDQLRDHLQTHLTELESLQSVFYNPGEIKIEDICALADIKDYVNNKTTVPPPYLDYTINLLIDNLKFELCVTLAHGYPKIEPEIFVRNYKLNRYKHIQLNKDLIKFVTNHEKGEPCISSVVSWVQDNASDYVQVEQEDTPLKKNVRNEKYIRYWIYSHHISSRYKRVEVVELANQLNITGFCMPVLHYSCRNEHIQLNKDLVKFITDHEKGEACIFSAVSWLQDNASDYVQAEKEETPLKKNVRDEKYIRYWIYSHHIYSKTKRREVVDLANQLNITGFCMPGKPGIICVEGASSDIMEWWQSIKSMNWKKIFCKVEEEEIDKEGRAFLKFSKFEEVVFQNSGLKFNHMDMGELFRYLEEHSLGYIFKDLFGVDAKSSSS